MQQRKIHHEDQIEDVLDAPKAHKTVRLAELSLVSTDDLRSVEAEWRRLEKLAQNSLHQGFDWCRAWAQAHRSELAIVQGLVDGRTLFILPLEIVSERRARIARLLGHRFNNVNTGLFDAELAAPDAEELQNFAHGLRLALSDKADLIVLDNIPLAWRGMQHPLSALASIENQNHSFQLPLLQGFEATLAQLNAKSRRKKFRSQSRKIEAIGGYDHFIPTDPAEKHALLDTFFHQKSERLRLFGLPDVFQLPGIQDFFHRLMDVPARGTDTPLTLHAIRLRGEHEGHIAAIAGLSRKGDHVICQFSSIDETICPEASPGELLFWLMIEQSCREGASVFDFGVGDQPYKRNWCTQETVQHDMLLPLTWKGSAMRPVLIGVTRAKAAVKRSPHLYAMAQRWRSRRCPKASEAPASDAEPSAN
ncbi:GNAT family N-acetyltransferase [Neorhizobium galegae]|uniref:GNAT family N-acetyltransferase n=1 Tax=Neorhizobium galegae TaxID=399 RepID=UPI0006221B5E|nr:GNAT family N-acetyltransferase [Neorhizobium galegae]MCQ1767670.1 GNAT family N-acetyltransferase [Neorhizobium galegae]MCQ1848009.1 GNAT family N-acetyltransferase [Neorhizobium galegae]CDZ42838.1 Protein involved in cellulose biosynthesis (CelD) [Neorhizobium galegae bv. officinalis]